MRLHCLIPARHVVRGLAITLLLAARAAAQSTGRESLSQVQIGVVLDSASRALFADDGRGLARRFDVALAAERIGAIIDGLPTQFRLHVSVTPSTEDVVPGTPALLLVRGTVSAIVEDSATRARVASWTTELQGTGQTPAQAWTSLGASLRVDESLQRVLRSASERIVTLYDARCSQILATAASRSAARDFDAAIYLLETVPVAAASCSSRAQRASIDVVTARDSYLCSTVLARARARWAASKSRETAAQVAEQLEPIDGSAPCYGDVNALLTDVAGRIGEYDATAQRAIEEQIAFERQQYADRLAMLREVNQSRERVALAQAASGTDSSRLALDVAREISLAYARSIAVGGRSPAVRVQVDPD
jgi:hypothetical protein